MELLKIITAEEERQEEVSQIPLIVKHYIEQNTKEKQLNTFIKYDIFWYIDDTIISF